MLAGILLITTCHAGTGELAEALENAGVAAAAGATNAPTATGTNAVPIPPKPHWESTASAGLTLTRGNSKTFLGTLSERSTGKYDKDEYNLGANLTYGESTVSGINTKNVEQESAFAQFNRLFSERLFAYARGEGLHDAIADVNYRVTLGPGAGYYFIKNKRASLRGEVGPGFIFQKQADHVHDYATFRAAEHFEFKFNGTAKLWQNAEVLPEVAHVKNYIVNAEIGVESAITKTVSMRTFLQDTYHNEPAAGRQKNDAKMVAAVTYKF